MLMCESVSQIANQNNTFHPKRDFGGQGPVRREGLVWIDELQNQELGEGLKGATEEFVPLKEKAKK